MASRVLWVRMDARASPRDKRRLLRSCRGLCDVVLVAAEDLALAKEAGFKVASFGSGDVEVYRLEDRAKASKAKKAGKKVAIEIRIRGKSDLNEAVEACAISPDYLLVSCENWKIIPLENLIASTRGKCGIIAEVVDASEAKTALETLELGSDGILLETLDREALKSVGALLAKEVGQIELVVADVSEVKLLPMGLRACVDTCEFMRNGEGMLVGSQSVGFFLVEAEVAESPFTSPRPFRVNAGAISSYVLTPDGSTKYLSELEAGSDVLLVERSGSARRGIVGRVKIERRPLVMVTAAFRGAKHKVVVQNAETIRFVTPDGSKPVTELKPGDKVLMKVEAGGRHFGTLVKEEFVIER